MKILDATFGHPRGLLGRLGGMIMARATAERNTWTIALLDIKPDNRILEVGCGPGALIHAIAEQTTETVIIGVDTSSVMLKQAIRRNAGFVQQRRVQLHHASALALPFAAAAFDIVVSANSVQLWSDQLAGIREMRRVLKSDGRIALIMQPVWVKANDEVKAIGNELLKLLSQAGFQSTSLAFKQMKPIGSVCVTGVR